jgi:phage recombination protein Bet
MVKKDDNKKPAAELVTVPSSAGELAPGQSQGQAIAFAQTPENIELLKASLSASGTNLSDSELGIFLYQAAKTGLDPLARQIYVMERGNGGVSFMTSIDGQRLVAQRTHEYDGQTSPEWCGSDGKWREVWLENGNPAAARVGVYRRGMREPVYGVATWKSYNSGRGTWNKMGDVMLAKCAEALALRKAFPQELSGLYTPEEMNSTEDAPEPPRVMTTQAALAEAGKALIDKGFSRDEALTIMTGIADVDDPSKLTGARLAPVLEIVHREDAEALSMYIPHDETPEAEVVTPPAGEKSVDQAMADGDAEPPASFLAPEPETEEPARPRFVVPDYKKGSSQLARPEMVKQFGIWAKEYGLVKKPDLERFCQNAIGKPAPQTFDDYKLAIEILADELNSQAEQGTLV